MPKPIHASLLLALALLAGCASGSRTDTTRMDATALYAEARRAVELNRHADAVTLFQQLESRFPFSQEAQQAQLEIIYSHYRSNNYEQAEAAADRFVREQPRHPDMDYVLYLRGLINYDRGGGLLDTVFRADTARRAQSLNLKAYQSFQLLVTSHPSSRYVPDAQQRMIHLRNIMARHELHVARYYMQLEAWVSAVSRARTVVEQYDETPSVMEALHILQEAYGRLGMHELAEDTARVIALNQQGSPM